MCGVPRHRSRRTTAGNSCPRLVRSGVVGKINGGCQSSLRRSEEIKDATATRQATSHMRLGQRTRDGLCGNFSRGSWNLVESSLGNEKFIRRSVLLIFRSRRQVPAYSSDDFSYRGIDQNKLDIMAEYPPDNNNIVLPVYGKHRGRNEEGKLNEFGAVEQETVGVNDLQADKYTENSHGKAGVSVIRQQHTIPATGNRKPTSKWEYIFFCVFCELGHRKYITSNSLLTLCLVRFFEQWSP